MSDIVIQVENISKQYRLGEVSTGSLGHDLNRWWHRIRSKEDPYLKVTQTNVREQKAEKLKSEKAEIKSECKSDPQISAFQNFSISAFSSDYVWALQDINFEVRRGEVLGVIGQNGAGKSTLLKIMSRITAPTLGEIRVKGRIASLLEVGTGFHPELTGRENIFLNGAILGMTKPEIASKLDEIVDFSGCARYLDTPVKRYSSGMIVRLGFAVAAHLDPEILIVDEVLAVGDLEFQKKCLGKMQDVASHGRTVLFVSHNMAAVQNLCSRTVWLDAGGVRECGETDTLVRHYEQSTCQRIVDNRNLPAGFIYARAPESCTDNYMVTGIELLDEKQFPKTRLATWDYVCFRIHYLAKVAVKRGSVELQILNGSGVPLMLCSTEPDANVPCEIRPGLSHVDCIFSQWPLSAGETLVNACLAIPMVEFLTSRNPLCRLQTEEKNVYHSSLAPRANRYQIAADHTWVLPGPSQ